VVTFKSNWDGIVQEVHSRRSPLYTIIRTIDVYNPWIIKIKRRTAFPISASPHTRSALISRSSNTTSIR
jgi:hypothetical protein